MTRRTVHYYISQGLLPPSRNGRPGHALPRGAPGSAAADPGAPARAPAARRDPLATGAPQRRPGSRPAATSATRCRSHAARPSTTSSPSSPARTGARPRLPMPSAPQPLAHRDRGDTRRPLHRQPRRSAPSAAAGMPATQPAMCPDRSAKLRRTTTPSRPCPIAPSGSGSSLAPDVELHVRRPLSRLQNRAVDRLVAHRPPAPRGGPVMTVTVRPDRRYIRTGYRSNRFLLVELEARPRPPRDAAARRSTSPSCSIGRGR